MLNEAGKVIGVLGGSTLPGARRYDSGTFGVNYIREGSLGTPIELVNLHASGPAKTLSELSAMGALVPPVVKDTELAFGAIGDHFDVKKGEFPVAREQRMEFSRATGHCEVILVWNPRTKIRAEVTMNVYDINNHAVIQSKPMKVKSSPGQYVTNRWGFELANLKASTYRVDVLDGDRPIWRTFFRLTD
ncbi:MAG: hypothetical protein LAO06_15835 [Acidobacteriia bacterium]|nr:hypothetical protein [Terriglobia bacterium]